MTAPQARTGVSTMVEGDDCFTLLTAATVGRVGFLSEDGVRIIPVSYRLASHRLFFTTSADGELSSLAERTQDVAFEVDYHASDFRRAWSVLMNGRVQRLDQSGQALRQRLRLPPVPWVDIEHPVDLQFIPRIISGRVLQRA